MYNTLVTLIDREAKREDYIYKTKHEYYTKTTQTSVDMIIVIKIESYGKSLFLTINNTYIVKTICLVSELKTSYFTLVKKNIRLHMGIAEEYRALL